MDTKERKKKLGLGGFQFRWFAGMDEFVSHHIDTQQLLLRLLTSCKRHGHTVALFNFILLSFALSLDAGFWYGEVDFQETKSTYVYDTSIPVSLLNSKNLLGSDRQRYNHQRTRS